MTNVPHISRSIRQPVKSRENKAQLRVYKNPSYQSQEATQDQLRKRRALPCHSGTPQATSEGMHPSWRKKPRSERVRLLLLGSLLLSGLGLLLGLLLGLGGLSSGLRLAVIGRGPESEVIPEELHDKGAVAVRLLGEGVELGDRIIESLLGEVAGTVRRVKDLVVENGEVEGKTQADRVGGSELGLSNIGSALHDSEYIRLARARL